ncbi:MAG: hypothetical protein ACI84D_001675 [Thalassolituus oleivorans]|jgi:hypothetical protein
MDHFDLDRAIAAWRRGLKRNRTLLADDLEELEEHLRDHIAELLGDGLLPKDAHDLAMRRLGGQGGAGGSSAGVAVGLARDH